MILTVGDLVGELVGELVGLEVGEVYGANEIGGERLNIIRTHVIGKYKIRKRILNGAYRWCLAR